MVNSMYSNFKNKKILFIEDDESTRNMMSRQLGFYTNEKVDVVNNCKNALNDFDINSYDMIITDYQMPVMNCDEFIPKVRLMNNSIPIFIVSADLKNNHEDIIEMYNINGYFEKPCKVVDIVESINNFYESSLKD